MSRVSKMNQRGLARGGAIHQVTVDTVARGPNFRYWSWQFEWTSTTVRVSGDHETFESENDSDFSKSWVEVYGNQDSSSYFSFTERYSKYKKFSSLSSSSVEVGGGGDSWNTWATITPQSVSKCSLIQRGEVKLTKTVHTPLSKTKWLHSYISQKMS